MSNIPNLHLVCTLWFVRLNSCTFFQLVRTNAPAVRNADKNVNLKPIFLSFAKGVKRSSPSKCAVEKKRRESVHVGAYLELDGGRTERKIADHLFPETRLVGRTWRTLAVVAEPHVRVPAAAAAAAASSVVQSNFVFAAGRADGCRPSRPAVVAVDAVHVPRLHTENLVTNGPGKRRVSVTRGYPRHRKWTGAERLRVASRGRIPRANRTPNTLELVRTIRASSIRTVLFGTRQGRP